MINIGIIIPTKDRPDYLKRLLDQLNQNKNFFKTIIVVDSSLHHKKKIRMLCNNYSFKITYIHSKPSISVQRNLGLKNINKNCNYVMFIDDDIILEKNSLFYIKKFINSNLNKYVGFGFNLILKKNSKFLSLRNRILNFLKLYSFKPGKVSRSGWHSLAYNLKKNTKVDWLATGVVIYDLKKIKKIFFDEFFTKYSYLEDLDFSYTVRKIGQMIIVSEAKYYHFNDIERSGFLFGKREIINRAYFVRKHNLNYKLFFIAAFLKSISNLFSFNFNKIKRSFGNLYALKEL